MWNATTGVSRGWKPSRSPGCPGSRSPVPAARYPGGCPGARSPVRSPWGWGPGAGLSPVHSPPGAWGPPPQGHSPGHPRFACFCVQRCSFVSGGDDHCSSLAAQGCGVWAPGKVGGTWRPWGCLRASGDTLREAAGRGPALPSGAGERVAWTHLCMMAGRTQRPHLIPVAPLAGGSPLGF